MSDENFLTLDSKNANILLVDDEESNLKLLTRILQSAGYQNIVATRDPRQTLPLLQEHRSDLLLLDLNMPHMNGYEVMDLLKSQITSDEQPPILILTAQSMQDYRQRALDSGARDYVTKPFDIEELLSRVRNLLEVHCAQKFMRNQNHILEDMVEARTRALQDADQKLRESRLQVVRRLGRAAEYRDNETGLHIIRMSKIAALLGQAAGMDEESANLLLNASPMHDIGKIGIPDHILLKPGRFEPEEWEIMKTHAQIGADILAEDDSDLLRMAREIALTHHEKWDGSGYPNGLQGEAIPLVGRITALADVFDALTSERPYKKAWSIDDAVALIKSESGKHFEPTLVEHFLQQLPGILEIRDEYAEPEYLENEPSAEKDQSIQDRRSSAQ
jgi:putative two-component system response regulator